MLFVLNFMFIMVITTLDRELVVYFTFNPLEHLIKSNKGSSRHVWCMKEVVLSWMSGCSLNFGGSETMLPLLITGVLNL